MAPLAQKKVSLLTERKTLIHATCLDTNKLRIRGFHLHPLIELYSALSSQIPKELRPSMLLTSQFLAYPESGGVLRRGVDILDVTICEGAKPLILEAKYIPEGAFEKPNIGLLVTPALLVSSKGGVVLIKPLTIIIIDALLQVSGAEGKINPRTGIPEQVSPEVLETLKPEERATFYRRETMGIKPLSIEIYHVGNPCIAAFYDSNQPFEVPLLEAA